MGRDKATLALPGPSTGFVEGRNSNTADTTMVEHVVGIVAQRCQPVFVMAASGQALPSLKAQVLRDELRGLGPLPATGRGLRAAADAGFDRAFVCAVDMPFLTVAFIDDLASRAAQLDADVVLPWDGHDHYLAAVYRTDLAERVDALVAAGVTSMVAFVNTVDAQRVVMPDSRVLGNINSVDDLHALPQVRR